MNYTQVIEAEFQFGDSNYVGVEIAPVAYTEDDDGGQYTALRDVEGEFDPRIHAWGVYAIAAADPGKESKHIADVGRKQDAEALAAVLTGYSALQQKGKAVVENWENGDLAGAVRDLASSLAA